MCEKSQILTSSILIYRRGFVFILLLFFIVVKNSFANDYTLLKDSLIKSLISNGFENIRIKVDDDKFILAYENRVFRFDIDAINEVLKIVAPRLNDKQNLILIPLNRKVPLVLFEAKVADCKDYLLLKITGKEFAEKLNIKFSVDKIWSEIDSENEYNSSNFKFDFTIVPSVKFQFGVFTDPVKYQLNLVPGLNTTLWKGVSMNYECILPLHNDLIQREDSVRTGLAVINQVFRLPGSFFISSSIGLFRGERYGFDLEAKKYFANGDVNFGFDIGCTGFAYFEGTRLFYSDQFTVTGSLSTEVRIPKYNLTLGIMIGRFLMGDSSIRFDIYREFEEVQVGFFAIKSSSGISNGGFNISIPIFPGKYSNPSTVRFRPAENFGWGYLVKTNNADLIGLSYSTDNKIDNFTKQLNPEFIKNIFGKN
jgi:hypothetical protein